MVKKRCTFKNLEEILKTWKKFRKPGENFQKFFGHPVHLKLNKYINDKFSGISKNFLFLTKVLISCVFIENMFEMCI